jgi:hypothetical protein
MQYGSIVRLPKCPISKSQQPHGQLDASRELAFHSYARTVIEPLLDRQLIQQHIVCIGVCKCPYNHVYV